MKIFFRRSNAKFCNILQTTRAMRIYRGVEYVCVCGGGGGEGLHRQMEKAKTLFCPPSSTDIYLNRPKLEPLSFLP